MTNESEALHKSVLKSVAMRRLLRRIADGQHLHVVMLVVEDAPEGVAMSSMVVGDARAIASALVDTLLELGEKSPQLLVESFKVLGDKIGQRLGVGRFVGMGKMARPAEPEGEPEVECDGDCESCPAHVGGFATPKPNGEQ